MGHSRWFGLFISQGSEWVLNSGCRERERERKLEVVDVMVLVNYRDRERLNLKEVNLHIRQ